MINKTPHQKAVASESALLFRQIELNWINGPKNDLDAYIGLYLDNEADSSALPVWVHKLNGNAEGHIISDYYLPQIDFYHQNATIDGHKAPNTLQLVQPTNTTSSINRNQLVHTLRSSLISSWNDKKLRNFSQRNLEKNNMATRVEQAAAISVDKLTDECIGYCIALHSSGQLLAQNCLRTNPTWMQDQMFSIGQRKLPWIMLPGTHNSATYARHLDKSALQMINKYQLNQDEPIFNQLVWGIRYLDLRVGWSKLKNRDDRLWIYHDIFRTDISLRELLEQVKKFLQLTSHELIIIDFHRFTVGFENEDWAIQRERHVEIIDLLYKMLATYIVPANLLKQATLGELVAQN